jgi:hypothetical protein
MIRIPKHAWTLSLHDVFFAYVQINRAAIQTTEIRDWFDLLQRVPAQRSSALVPSIAAEKTCALRVDPLGRRYLCQDMKSVSAGYTTPCFVFVTDACRLLFESIG